jgi:hypothetical protein
MLSITRGIISVLPVVEAIPYDIQHLLVQAAKLNPIELATLQDDLPERVRREQRIANERCPSVHFRFQASPVD